MKSPRVSQHLWRFTWSSARSGTIAMCLTGRFALFVLLFACCCIPVQAQSDDEGLDQQLAQIDEMLIEAEQSDSDTQREQLANQCLARARSVRYESGMIKASLLLGEVCARTGRSEKALRHYLEAENRSINNKNLAFLPNVYRVMGNLFFEQRMYAQARRYYGEVLKTEPGNMLVLEQVADAALYEQKYDTAEIHYKSLITRYKLMGDNVRLVHIYQKLANAYQESGNYGKSLLYYLRIEDIVERFGEPYEKGRLYNNLGKVYVTLKDYKKALEYFKKTELQCDYAKLTIHPCELPELLYTNLGISLHNTGDSKGGLTYLGRALNIIKARKDEKAMANLEHLIATVYFSSGDLYNALEHNNEAIRLGKATEQVDVQILAYETAAKIYQDLYDFENAFLNFTQYLTLYDSTRLDEQRRQLLLAERSSQLRAAEGEIRFLLAQQEIKDRDLQQVRVEQEKLELVYRALAAEAREREQDVVLLQKQKEVDQATLREKTALALEAQQRLRLAAEQLDTEKKNAIITELSRKNEIEQAEQLAKEQEMTLLRQERDISDLKLREQQNFERNTYIGGSILGFFLLVFSGLWLFARRVSRRLKVQNVEIQAQKNMIDAERSKSDRLLRNILPEEIAHELKTRGHASPQLYPAATVMFTDFVNFTKLSAHLPPEQVISELNECFLAFDEIIDRHGLEKIKTIGDAFMCAGGLPVPNETHPIDAVKAAIEINKWLQHRKQNYPDAVFHEMRIGIHTGAVVAGVVGKNKFAYDIWGDAVNLASRMEEMGEAGRINLTKETYALVKDVIPCEFRGQREVHNKGMIDMYFVV
jgi:adenylate cyclase